MINEIPPESQLWILWVVALFEGLEFLLEVNLQWDSSQRGFEFEFFRQRDYNRPNRLYSLDLTPYFVPMDPVEKVR